MPEASTLMALPACDRSTARSSVLSCRMRPGEAAAATEAASGVAAIGHTARVRRPAPLPEPWARAACSPRSCPVDSARQRRRRAPSARRTLPCSAICPSRMTMIRSASRTVESRCAMTKVVRPSVRLRSAAWMRCSVVVVERTGGFIQDEDGSVLDHRTRDRQTLAFAARQATCPAPRRAPRSRPV